LLERCYKILEVDLSDSNTLLKELEEEDKIKVINDNVYLLLYYNAERFIENKIEIMGGSLSGITDKDLKSIKLKTGYYSLEQLEAINDSLKHKILILTGGPGTGKTTTLKGIINAYRQLGKSIMLAAPTGRAAKRMSEVIGIEAKTIHRLLEYNPIDDIFVRDKEYPLEVDLLVIDEVSMIDTLLMSSLLDAIAFNTTLILVGDSDQLPSVGAGNILSDLINTKKIPTVNLTKIFRQAEESRIVVNSHRINKGEFPIIHNDQDSDFFFINEPDDSRIAQLIIELCNKRLPEKYGFDPMKDIQVLSPMYKGETGADNLNTLLQSALNKNKVLLTRGERNFRIGDKVMQLRNNYDKEIFNGDIGIIFNIDLEDQELKVNFNERIVPYEFTDLDEITLAYAITVHKSQGSEYPCVVLPLTTAHFIMLQRNLLYTAVTRASKLMILIGSKQALAMAMKNKKSKKRYTSLFKNFS
jgi:exodeoxyribonuclease V alpha subunit